MTSDDFQLLKGKTLLLKNYPVEIEFLRVTTRKDNRRTRRGNYNFLVTVQEQVDEEVLPFIFNIHIQPNQPDYFIQKTFQTTDKELLEEGDMLKAFLIKQDSELITDLELIDSHAIERMKKAIVFCLHNIQYWNRNGGGIVTHTYPKIGKIVIATIGRYTEDLDNHF